MKKIRIRVILLIMTFMFLLFSGYTWLISSKTVSVSSFDVQIADNKTYLILSFGPKLLLHINNEDKVMEMNQLNEEAFIFTNEEFKDLELIGAINKIIDIALLNGYLKTSKELDITTPTGWTKVMDENLEVIVNFIEERGLSAKIVEFTEEQEREIMNVIQN